MSSDITIRLEHMAHKEMARRKGIDGYNYHTDVIPLTRWYEEQLSKWVVQQWVDSDGADGVDMFKSKEKLKAK